MRRIHNGLCPPLPAAGPVLPPRRPVVVALYDMTLYVNPSTVLLETEESELEAALRRCAASQPVSWTKFLATTKELQAQFTEEDAAMCGISLRQLAGILGRLEDPDTWPMFQNTFATEVKQERDLAFYEEWCYDLQRQEDLWTQRSDPPRPIARERIILHAFSGRRRLGDVQHYLDQLQAGQDALQIWMISVDIVIDARFGDVASGATRRFWLHGIQQRWILGFLGGPPCNTWSRARGKELCGQGQHPGPRIVRTAEEPWGLPSLRLRELEDVILGNILLTFSLLAVCALSLTNGVAILEHPKEPKDQELASIWRVMVMAVIRQLDGVQIISVSQGLFGAPSPKPTDLLILNIPNIVKILHSWRVTFELPRACTIGKALDGQYNTAGLKEYPPALCGGLAQGFWDALAGMAEDVTQEIPPDFLAQCDSMRCSSFGHFMGPDLAGHQ